MNYVYILKSLNNENKIYIGFTTQKVDIRLAEHNKGQSVYTKKYAPWVVETYVAFKSKSRAKSFEGYLKKGSGHAFLHKRLIS